MADNFDFASYQSAIESCMQDIEAKSHTLVDDLAGEAAGIAQNRFQNAFYAGNNDVSVHVEQDNVRDEYGKAIVALGTSVLFIEFGTGIRKMDNPAERAQLYGGGKGIVGHGQYGKGRGKQLNGWVYKGEPGVNPPWDTYQVDYHGSTYVHTKGNHAWSCLWMARQQIAKIMRQRAREIFK